MLYKCRNYLTCTASLLCRENGTNLCNTGLKSLRLTNFTELRHWRRTVRGQNSFENANALCRSNFTASMIFTWCCGTVTASPRIPYVRKVGVQCTQLIMPFEESRQRNYWTVTEKTLLLIASYWLYLINVFVVVLRNRVNLRWESRFWKFFFQCRDWFVTFLLSWVS